MIKEKLIKELRRIRDLPEDSGNSCHEDHEEMSEELNKLIDKLIGKCKHCGRGRN